VCQRSHGTFTGLSDTIPHLREGAAEGEAGALAPLGHDSLDEG